MREMEANENTVKLYYNTERPKLQMPEYGRSVLGMVEQMKAIDDRQKRSEQARAIVKAMELLNPQVRQQEDYVHKLWDHLYMIAGLDLDIDSPFPAPAVEELSSRPEPVLRPSRPIKATHYGRNIESVMELICNEPEGEARTSLIRSLAIYMRQQYLIWNKDSVSDETIFSDIEKLSGGRIVVPEGTISLSRISDNATFARPGIMGQQGGQQRQGQGKNRRNRRRTGKGGQQR